MNPKIILTIVTLIALIGGLFMFFGALRNWNNIYSPHIRINLVELFGVYGRLLYMLIGLIIIIFSILAGLGFNDIGPLAPYISLDKQ
jgi:hypothetical protein